MLEISRKSEFVEFMQVKRVSASSPSRLHRRECRLGLPCSSPHAPTPFPKGTSGRSSMSGWLALVVSLSRINRLCLIVRSPTRSPISSAYRLPARPHVSSSLPSPLLAPSLFVPSRLPVAGPRLQGRSSSPHLLVIIAALLSSICPNPFVGCDPTSRDSLRLSCSPARDWTCLVPSGASSANSCAPVSCSSQRKDQ